MSDVTQILSQIEQGGPTAAEQLLPLVYDELRRLAAAKFENEKPGQTIQATALVHEAYIEQSISLGCPLSPLLGALFLDVLDRRMEAAGLCYGRFMDDWLVLAPTRWKLRDAIKRVNQTLAELKVEQHPDKTFIGRICRGFEFLGYRIHPGRIFRAAPV